jgi:predicted  nucleic acid-binding Zn-ribbon protein
LSGKTFNINIMKIEVSNGEITDKLTIIEIKLERISDEAKLVNLRKEYDVLNEAVSQIIDKNDPLYKELYDINCQLWDIEDRIRDLERNKDFGQDFIETARAVYFTNDKRSDVKRRINEKTGSNLVEEKSYEDYQ